MLTYRTLRVLDSHKLTPNMQRIRFTGGDLRDFPASDGSQYLKLLFAEDGQPLSPTTLAALPEGQRPVMRTYTISSLDRTKGQLAMDFVLHGGTRSEGPAVRWAQSAQAGDILLVAGPGSSAPPNPDADWFLLVGDMTALPAISRHLERLPDSAQGYAILEICDDGDKQQLKTPTNVEIRWVVNPPANRRPAALRDAVAALPWRAGTPGVWAACEFDAMRLLRQFFCREQALPRQNIYISSYWRQGRSEDQHKIDKQRDAASRPSL